MVSQLFMIPCIVTLVFLWLAVAGRPGCMRVLKHQTRAGYKHV